MEKRDIEAFKSELMRLYSQSTANTSQEQKSEEVPEHDNETNITEEQTTESFPDTESTEEQNTESFPDTGNNEETELAERFPIPDISDIAKENEPESPSEESMGDSVGFILVNVRTGHETTPIVGATVVVTAVNDGKRLLIASGKTDISGTVKSFEAPAPNKAYSQYPNSKVRPYSLFDVSVSAKGFFNARSVDIPVFAGETSIQNFNMLPLPLGAKSDDETLTYFNQEPN